MHAEEAKERARACCSNPKLVITYLWFTILFFAFMFSIGAIVMAANNNGGSSSDNKSLGFAGVWMMLLIIALSVGGTMVMRKFQTPLAVGFFIGVCVMMAFNMFSLGVLYSGAAYVARRDKDGDVHSDEAAATFSIFLSILYSIFSVILIKHRNVIIKDGIAAHQDNALPEKMAPVVNISSGSTPAPSVPQRSPSSSGGGAPPVSV